MIYSKKEWLQIKEILNNRKQGKYPGIDKKKEEKRDAIKQNNYQQLQKHSAS